MGKILLTVVVCFAFMLNCYSQMQGQNVFIMDSTGIAKMITIYKDTVINEWSFHKVAGKCDSVFLATPIVDTLEYYLPHDTAYLNPNYELRSVKDDSTHYFFTHYIKLKDKGVPDSMNHWYYKLSNNK